MISLDDIGIYIAMYFSVGTLNYVFNLPQIVYSSYGLLKNKQPQLLVKSLMTEHSSSNLWVLTFQFFIIFSHTKN